MSTIETQQQADELNARGEWGPYHAANGHLMIAPLRYPRPERELRIGDEIRSDSWAAWCAPSCAACSEGEALPDW